MLIWAQHVLQGHGLGNDLDAVPGAWCLLLTHLGGTPLQQQQSTQHPGLVQQLTVHRPTTGRIAQQCSWLPTDNTLL